MDKKGTHPPHLFDTFRLYCGDRTVVGGLKSHLPESVSGLDGRETPTGRKGDPGEGG